MSLLMWPQPITINAIYFSHWHMVNSTFNYEISVEYYLVFG